MWGVGGVCGSFFQPRAGRCRPPIRLSEQAWPGRARSDTEALAHPPPPPPPSRAPKSAGPVKVGAVPNRRLGGVHSEPMATLPGRRARLSSPGTSRLSSEAREELRRRLQGLIEDNRVMIFSKSYCPHSTRVGGAGRACPSSGALGPQDSGGALPVPPSDAHPRGPTTSRRAGAWDPLSGVLPEARTGTSARPLWLRGRGDRGLVLGLWPVWLMLVLSLLVVSLMLAYLSSVYSKE